MRYVGWMKIVFVPLCALALAASAFMPDVSAQADTKYGVPAMVALIGVILLATLVSGLGEAKKVRWLLSWTTSVFAFAFWMRIVMSTHLTLEPSDFTLSTVFASIFLATFAMLGLLNFITTMAYFARQP